MRNNILNEGYHKNKKSFTKSNSCYIIDKKKNRYIDMTMGSGTHILGHNHPTIVKALKKQLNKSILFTTKNTLAKQVGNLISKAVPTIEKVIFCNTGSEATMRAARIARNYTKKKKIAIFSGAWHGGNELFLYDFDYNKGDGKTYHKSAGIPDEFKDLVIVLPYNDEKAFKIIEKNKNDIAMVIVEPSQGSNPRDDMKQFLNRLRKVTSKNKIVLCFDEMITGFRVALGGAQEYYNIEADLVTYGKTIGGGLPIGVVCGKAKIMNTIKGDDQNLSTFMGGTFSANPLTLSSAKALLKYLLLNKNSIYPMLDNNANLIKSSMNDYCISNNIKLRMIGLNSMLRFIFTDYPIKSRQDRDKYELSIDIQNKFYKYLLDTKDIFINSNGIIFLSISHKTKIVKYIIKSFIEAIDTIKSKT
jgi:glutamate-1-semialdehyde 2,1-aminomutase